MQNSSLISRLTQLCHRAPKGWEEKEALVPCLCLDSSMESFPQAWCTAASSPTFSWTSNAPRPCQFFPRCKNYKKRCLFNTLHKAYGLEVVKTPTHTERCSIDQHSLFYSYTCTWNVQTHTEKNPKHDPNLKTKDKILTKWPSFFKYS